MVLVLLSIPALHANDVDMESETSMDDEDVEQTTVVGTRTEHSLNEVAASFSITTAKDIEHQIVQNLADLVRFEPGISVDGTGIVNLGLKVSIFVELVVIGYRC